MTTSDLLRTYAAILEANSALNRSYYENPNPTSADRSDYHLRIEQLECLREFLYAALNAYPRAWFAKAEVSTIN